MHSVILLDFFNPADSFEKNQHGKTLIFQYTNAPCFEIE